MILRDYQQQAVGEVAEHLAAGLSRILLVSPTGSGKTVMTTEIMRAAAASGYRVLFLVHRRELVKQTAATLDAFNLPCGIILAGTQRRDYEPIQVASIQTLARRDMAQFALVVVDEAHHMLESNTYGQLLARVPNARVVGATATPWRLDGQGLADLWQAYVLTRTPSQLRDEGHLVPVTGHVFKALDVSGVRTSRGDYRETELARVALPKEILGDVVGEWLARAKGQRTILFACGVEHSKRFAAEFNAAGVPAEHVDGKTPKAERDAIFDRVRRGVTQVVCNCSVATEGFDLPQLSCVILARPTQSESLYLQMVGRVLRPCEGKPFARIHDHAGCVEMHGEPYAERDYSPRREKRAKREGPAPNPRCGECGAITSDNPCPECGSTKVAREAPKVNPEAVAVPLEEVAAQVEQKKKLPNKLVVFDTPGQEVTGALNRITQVQGRFGQTERFTLVGPEGNIFWFDSTTDLQKKMPREIGSVVRVVYVGQTDTGKSSPRKDFKVFLQGQITEKTCTRCGHAQPFDHFSPAKLGRFGRHALCKVCASEYGREKAKAQHKCPGCSLLVTGKPYCDGCEKKKRAKRFRKRKTCKCGQPADKGNIYCYTCRKAALIEANSKPHPCPACGRTTSSKNTLRYCKPCAAERVRRNSHANP